MGEEMADSILRTTYDFHDKCTYLLHAARLRHGRDGFTSPPKEGKLWIFMSPEKIRRLQPGLKPQTRVLETIECVLDRAIIETGFPIISVFSCQYHSTIAPYDSLICHGQYTILTHYLCWSFKSIYSSAFGFLNVQ
jgi:hypothetical protein